MTRVKICGITRAEDLLKALEFGADALGFNFSKVSPRYLDPQEAGKLCQMVPEGVLKVGVFVNQPLESLLDIATAVKLDYLQLHGDETIEYCQNLSAKKLIKAFRLNEKMDFSQFKDYLDVVDYLLIDGFHKTVAGGTGLEIEEFLLNKYKELNLFSQTILAGGLTPLNVEEKIREYFPFAVDVASGVEDSPGIKNATKMKDFILAAKKVK